MTRFFKRPKLPNRLTFEIEFITNELERKVTVIAEVEDYRDYFSLGTVSVRSGNRERELNWKQSKHPKFFARLMNKIDELLARNIEIFEENY